MPTMNAMRKAALDVMRLYHHAAFRAAEIFQDQLQKSWAMIMEQHGKMRSGMEDMVAAWMLNAQRAREELKLNLEQGLSAMEESAGKPGDGYGPPAGTFADWTRMQMEAVRGWVGIWGFAADTPGAESGKQTADAQAGKDK